MVKGWAAADRKIAGAAHMLAPSASTERRFMVYGFLV
jgi:hypothetical protein